MAQQPGLMNTAPSPIPGGYSNPTGAGAIGTPSAAPGTIPQAYGPTPGALPTTAGTGGFPANTGGVGGTGTTIAPGLQNLSSGSGANPGMLLQLQNDYGKGVGQAIYDMLSKGMFNPQVANALIAAMQPQIERGLSSTEAAFGAEGARFSSSAQIGVGDYMSQAVLGENQVLANMYQQDQQMQLSLLENILPTVHQEQADSQKGWLSDLLGGIEMGVGILGAPFTGGASLGLAGSGAKTISGGNTSSGSVMPSSPWALGTAGWSTGTGSPIPGVGNDSAFTTDLMNQWLSESAGATAGGVPNDPNSSVYSLLGMQG